jgi:hypothetical protein
MTRSASGFRLERGTVGPRIFARTAGGEMLVAEFPRSGTPRADTLRPVFARLCLAALQSGFEPEMARGDGAPTPLELLGLAMAACDEADTAFAVLQMGDGITPQGRRALGEAWVLVQEAIGGWRGPGSVHAQAARENRAVLRGSVAGDAVDRYAAALAAGADAKAARAAAVAAAAHPPSPPPAGTESVWDLARECVAAWPAFDGDQPVDGAGLVEWFAEMRQRLSRALQLRPR